LRGVSSQVVNVRSIGVSSQPELLRERLIDRLERWGQCPG
jgi:hypothetical protein